MAFEILRHGIEMEFELRNGNVQRNTVDTDRQTDVLYEMTDLLGSGNLV